MAYEEWHPFFGIFDSLIHSNDTLNDIQKFHYLKSSLKGDAAETIQSLEITGANYGDAWSRLKARYENERVSIQNHIKSIFELPSIRKENSVALRSLLDSTLKHTTALAALKRPIAHWDDLLIYILAGKLDYFTIKEWENSLDSKQVPKFNELIEFLTKRCETLEAVARRSLSIESSSRPRQTTSKTTNAHAAVASVKCAHCNGDHQIYQCKTFKELSITDCLNKIRSLKLCLNCLKGKHFARDCNAGHCRKCMKKHSTLLHDDNMSSKGKEETSDPNPSTLNEAHKKEDTICTYTQSKRILTSTQVLLSTVVVLVKNRDGQYIEGKALVDNGSQSNFVTEEFVEKVNVKTRANHIEIKGISQHISHAMKSAQLHVSSRFNTFGLDMQFIVLEKITQNLPTIEVNVTDLDIPKNIKLADPNFNIPSKIDILIGAERFWELVCVGQIRLGRNKPILQKSLLGWLVSGSINIVESKKHSQTSCNLSTLEELCQTVQRFWEVENYANIKNSTSEEKYCERLFETSYMRQNDGRFVVKLPVEKEILPLLNGSREVALKRFLALERKFSYNPELRGDYITFMKEYQQLGHNESNRERER
ncbi:PREDICTED: uncharacterized protein LOC108767813 [Trachymyrmex cornetzi]|uniref:uncharacterized protein LOC108767813 n=1 Tax=Trachymyrmex cornetzi TaxID=471704 RepID=UPI00084F07AC|nr:PREDICTED: uncharacterized protein LOC108767813 [Trachymyrmex cornetzi]